MKNPDEPIQGVHLDWRSEVNHVKEKFWEQIAE